uniref:Uncharacterized protein n=1 Tax=Chlamydomonas euryale TaxID=1486919 RepID=A0A7R9VKM5_9CHLO|mmetsp:Transcript_37935/g.112317  ORF Transcript_37935/g.112317 Transcript_37935/m.112317 type:complete len:454 (+) Transcript_37935:306-1667(+)
MSAPSTAPAAERLAVLAAQLNPSRDATAAPGAGLARQATAAAAPGFNKAFPQATTAGSFAPEACDALNLQSMMSPDEQAIRKRVREYMVKEVAPVIADFWDRAEFPFQLVPGFAKLRLAGGGLQGNGCSGLSLMESAMAVVEIARVDCSMSTFLLVHSYLAMLTIGLLGSEQQKAELLPPMARLEWAGCWALTEPAYGSDAAAIQTTATKVPGGWMIDGNKRWIGNGTWSEVTVVWARNSETRQVNAFIVRKGTPGFKAEKIENKIALRCVQNADMTFERCFVPETARLAGVESFKDTNKVLAISRIMVAWQPVGACMGVYDMTARYIQERQQFGAPLAAFQLVQERMARMLGTVQAMFLMAHRLTRLYEEGKVTHEQASLVKAWNTQRAREVCALGREVLGGNGIVTDYGVAKAFCDVEAFYSYEGTYDVNALVAGRGITGVSAFKTTYGKK